MSVSGISSSNLFELLDSGGVQSQKQQLQQEIQQLGKDLSAGNLSGAQQDFSAIQQDIQSQGGGHHHHAHAQDSSGAQQNPIAELFNELGQALQSGNLSAAQQAYTTLQQDFQAASNSGSSSSAPASAGVQTVA